MSAYRITTPLLVPLIALSMTRPVRGQDHAIRLPAFEAAEDAFAERESIARGFVAANHPELARLLERLKVMNPDEYQKAIAELAEVSRSLDAMKARDPRRFELSLDIWKAKSRVDLLTARFLTQGERDPTLRRRLRQALAAQVEAESRRLAHDRDQAAARLARLTESLERLETDRDAIVTQRLERILRRNRTTAPRATTPRTNAPATPAQANRPGQEKL